MHQATSTSTIVAIYAGPQPVRRSLKISIRHQVIRCWNYSNKRGWRVNHIFVDQGGSESLVKRTNFQTMLKAARIGKFDIVVFCKLECFCPTQEDLIAAQELMKKSRIAFRNATNEGG